MVSDEIRATVTDHVARHPPCLKEADLQYFSIAKNIFLDILHTLVNT